MKISPLTLASPPKATPQFSAGAASASNEVGWTNQAVASKSFADFIGGASSTDEKQLHWYVACRLVVEGGFDPDDITPCPPFRVERRAGEAPVLHYAPECTNDGERGGLGGPKLDNADVVVTHDGVGPALAVSFASVTGAFSNFIDRLPETIAQCTNVHLAYPEMVLGHVVLLRTERHTGDAIDAFTDDTDTDDSRLDRTARVIAITPGGGPVPGIVRVHDELSKLVERRGFRQDARRFEAIGLVIAEMHADGCCQVSTSYPPSDSVLGLERFFAVLYRRYDERFVTIASKQASTVPRLKWAANSPGLEIL